MLRKKVIGIGLGALFIGALWVSPLRGQQRDSAAADKIELLKAARAEMRAACDELIKIQKEKYRTGTIALESLQGTQNLLIHVELESARTIEERAKMLAGQLELAKEIEKEVSTMHQLGMVGQSDVLQSQIGRMRIEILLLAEDAQQD